jgi:LysR family glycine cleavage system transcriptional activator
MTYMLPPLNALRAFEVAARHLSFKLAANELHVTPAAVGQQVKALEARLGVGLFERLHKHLILTPAGQMFIPEISAGLRRIADATAQLKPVGACCCRWVCTRASTCAGCSWPSSAPHMPRSGCVCLPPAGLPELVEGKVDLLVDRGLGHHPGYVCNRVTEGAGLGDWLIAPGRDGRLSRDFKLPRLAAPVCRPGTRVHGTTTRGWRPSAKVDRFMLRIGLYKYRNRLQEP